MRYPISIFGIATAFMLLCGQTCPAQTSPFDQWDQNGDEKLTRDELPKGMRGNFGRVDADSDGFITRDEDAKFRSRRRSGTGRDTPRPSDRRPQSRRQDIDQSIGGIKTILDIPYADTDNPRQSLDLLLPESHASDARLPVIVFIHGGGWRGGDKRSGHARVRPFVESGHYAVLVPIHQSELLETALRKAKIDVTFVPISGAGHGLRGVDTSEQVTAFFTQHLRETKSALVPTDRDR